MSLNVEIVAADRKVWSGSAKELLARTVDGDLGILSGHTPLLATLGEGEVTVVGEDGTRSSIKVDGGFLSVDHDTVTVVSETVDASAFTAPAAV